MKTFKFSIRYEDQGILFEGTATVVGEYDGPSKPEAMVRWKLEEHACRNFTITFVSESL